MSNLEAYIRENLRKTKKYYLETPELLVSNYYNEMNKVEEYSGRQFFELIQNADDAAVSAEKKHMYISISKDKLIVANNGDPFSEQSYASLFYPHISPKKKKDLIGNKGLGFRSILSWAKEITIHSGEISVRFSDKIRDSFWNDLKADYKKRETISIAVKHELDECPPAKLSVPQIVKQRNKSLPDYDTVIELSLKENVLEEILDQLENVMQPEALLFFNNLTQIKIVNQGSETVIAREISKTTLHKEMRLKVSGEKYEIPQIKTWYLLEHKFETRIDKEIKKVNISIAYKEDLDDSVNYLYSFYRTNVQFTAPVIIHASFDLTQDRKSLIGNEINRLIFKKIAWFLCESAEKFTQNKKLSPDFALRFIDINKGACDSTVEIMGFFDALREELINAKIIPTVNSEFISFADDPVSLPDPIWTYFAGEDVSDLVDGRYLAYYESLFELVGIRGYVYNKTHLCSLIHKNFEELDPSAIVELYEYITPYSMQNYDSSELENCEPIRINTKKQFIDPSKKVFLSLSIKSEYSLPEEIEIDFLDEEISREIEKRGFEDRFQDYLNIHRYSLVDVVSIITDHYEGSESVDDIMALHKALYQVYQAALNNNENVSIMDIQNIKVVAKNNDVVSANSVYFGKEFDNELTGTIYRALPSKILGSPKQNGLHIFEKEVVKQYFKWLQVKEHPKFLLSDSLDGAHDFLYYILSNYDYKKYRIGEYQFNSYFDLLEKGRLQSYLQKYSFVTIDGLNNILRSINIDTLLLWIVSDPELKNALKNNHDKRGKLELLLGQKHYLREVDSAGIKSYIRWRISNSPILQDSGNPDQRVAPNICCLSKTIRSEYSPYIVRPKIDYRKLSKKLDLSNEEIDELLGYIGVHKSIETFSADSLYQILLNLPEKDPDGNQAKAIYREVLNYNENTLDINNEYYKSFMEEGQVLCRSGGGREYVPISEAFYLSENKYSESIQARFKLIDLDYKKGNRKVEKLFGVKPLGKVEIIILEEPEINYLNVDLQNFLNDIMPYAYAFVHSKDADGKILGSLKHTKIILVDDVKAELIHSKIRDEVDLKAYEYIEVLERNEFYIKTDKEVRDFGFLINEYGFKDSISQIYASIVGAESDQMYRLFGESKNNWNKVLDGIFGIEYSEELIIAKEKLGRQINEHFEFWDFFASKVLPEFEDISISNDEELRAYLEKAFNITDGEAWLWNSETYNRLDRPEVRTGFYKLFKNKDIDFNRLSRRYSQFDFRKDIERELIEIKDSFEPAFKASLFYFLKDKDIESKSKFLSICIEYDTLIKRLDIPNYVKDTQEFFMNAISDRFGFQLLEEELNVNEVIKYNISKWSDGISFSRDGKIMQSKTINSLLLFGEFEAATEEAERVIEENNDNGCVRVAGSDIEYDQITDTNAHLDEILEQGKLKIINATIGKAEVAQSKSSSKARSNRISENKNTQDIGYAAEYLAYHKLVEEYGTESVEWVSKYAAKAGVNVEGRDGKGFDILLRVDGIERFVEVKSIRTPVLGFNMSKNELKTALDFPDRYDILIVQSITESPEFFYIKSFFDIPKKQKLSKNNKFTMHLNSAKIVFNYKGLS